ncbi:MAG: hypothetical protein CVU64_23680 [Deltaproteobacteria bacterium HGW-Deltaproteobacteria-21]|nr:MAG: hypothetical protein CVU64_23680 [Deltaproteobacteria bacterium HGW-Deltaproteobacteria-21]
MMFWNAELLPPGGWLSCGRNPGVSRLCLRSRDLGFRVYLSELIVRKSERGRGFARKLVERIHQELTTRGCAVLIPDVWREAEGFFKSLGWSEPDVKLLRR